MVEWRFAAVQQWWIVKRKSEVNNYNECPPVEAGHCARPSQHAAVSAAKFIHETKALTLLKWECDLLLAPMRKCLSDLPETFRCLTIHWGPHAAGRALTHSHDMALSGISQSWWMRMEPVKDEDPGGAAIRRLISCAAPQIWNDWKAVQLQMEAKFHSAEENYFQK